MLTPDDISFVLNIQLSKPPAPIGRQPGGQFYLLNLQADEDATLTDITVDEIYRTEEPYKKFTNEEINNLVIYEKDEIEFRFKHFEDRSRNASKKYYFPSNKVTIKQFVDAIIDFEKLTRPMNLWCGGIDCHHIFYEGISGQNGSYIILYGS